MSELHMTFRTNLPDSVDNFSTPSIDYISFFLKDGREVSLSANGTSYHSISDGIYELEMLGVDVLESSKDVLCTLESEMSAYVFPILEQKNIEDILLGIYLYNYDYSNKVIVKDLKIQLKADDKKHNLEFLGYVPTHEEDDCSQNRQHIEISQWPKAKAS